MSVPLPCLTGAALPGRQSVMPGPRHWMMDSPEPGFDGLVTLKSLLPACLYNLNFFSHPKPAPWR